VKRVAAVRRILPWISLAIGIASALWMDRRPERAPLVALAAVAGWLLLCALAWLEAARSRALLTRAARLGASLGSQSLLQLCLFFSAPFFARAAATPAHWGFVALVIAAGAITLWTPLSAALIKHPVAGATLQAVATFAGLDCVLPLVGLSNRLSLPLAAAVAAVGLPLLALVHKRRALPPLGVAAALLAALWAGGARVVPPAPLRFVDGQLGTRIVDRRVPDAASTLATVPEQLVCATTIFAPRGLRDRLRHVWRQNGALRAEVPLEIRGGREQGFRTWSVKHAIAPGKWTCTVETESGQLLGRVSIRVQGP
jgi:hypothetical protein